MTAADEASALDAMRAAPDHHAILLENDQVRVLDTRLGPGERTPVHTHGWPATLYVMSWSDFVRRNANGDVIVNSRSWDRQPAPGEALWLPPTNSAFGRKYRTVRTAAHRSRAEDWLNPRDMSAMGGTLSRSVVAGVKRNRCLALGLPLSRQPPREAPELLAKAEPSKFDAADPAVFSWPWPVPRAQGNRRNSFDLANAGSAYRPGSARASLLMTNHCHPATFSRACRLATRVPSSSLRGPSIVRPKLKLRGHPARFQSKDPDTRRFATGPPRRIRNVPQSNITAVPAERLTGQVSFAPPADRSTSWTE